jgi:hypothetical protein
MADHRTSLRLWVLSELVGKRQGYQHNQPDQDRSLLRLSGRPEVLATRVRSYSKIAPHRRPGFSDNLNRKQRYEQPTVRVNHQARKSLKTLLHLAAMSALQVKGDLQQYYQRKVTEGKNKMLPGRRGGHQCIKKQTAPAARSSIGSMQWSSGVKNMTKLMP